MFRGLYGINRLVLKPLIIKVGVFGIITASFVAQSENSPKKSGGGIDLSCENPVCSDQMAFFRKASAGVLKDGKQQDSSSSELSYSSCPLDKNELGNNTWAILHTIAAYYPDEPTEEQKNAAISLIVSLSLLYPCPYCAADFRESIAAHPPWMESREALSLWLCEQHNLVNKKLGKPIIPCTISYLDHRWRYGDDRCWQDPNKVLIQDSDEIENEPSNNKEDESSL